MRNKKDSIQRENSKREGFFYELGFKDARREIMENKRRWFYRFSFLGFFILIIQIFLSCVIQNVFLLGVSVFEIGFYLKFMIDAEKELLK